MRIEQKSAENDLSAAAGVTAEDTARRAAYLKEQRDKILAKKRAERCVLVCRGQCTNDASIISQPSILSWQRGESQDVRS